MTQVIVFRKPLKFLCKKLRAMFLKKKTMTLNNLVIFFFQKGIKKKPWWKYGH